ncbi:MAG: LPS export ABC transporter periplasmic protein LptC [Moraxellaceae bacterium]|nr:LPS export ABC transporter periplasmic protein LptC [Moraxellaceae bacterium]
MKNKLLFAFAVLVAVIAGWFFGHKAKIEPPVKISAPEIDYEATDIQAVQTNEKGETEYEVNAKSLSHNNKTNKDELVDVTMDWQPNENSKYQITSGLSDFNQETGKITMSKGFKLVSKQENAEPIVIVGESLTGNTKLKQVTSDKPIRFKQGDNQFQANGMKANLETGDYEFDHIQIDFNPSERFDEPLF